MTRVLPITVGLMLLLAAPAGAQEVIDTITVPFTSADPVSSDVGLKEGTNYTLVVSGTGKQTSDEGTVECDPLYCLNDSGRVFTRTMLTFSSDGTGEIGGLDDVAGESGNIPYEPGHTYSVPVKPQFGKVSGKLRAEVPPGQEVACNQSGITCSGGFTIQIYGPAGGTGCGKAGARAAAINEVRVVKCVQECEYRTSERGAWTLIEKDTILQQGHEITCDPDGTLSLAFADNSIVVVHNTTQLKIASFFTEGGVVRTELLLKMGEISAKVNKSETTRSDFKIKSPTAVSSVRGTEFSVFYDPIGKASLTSVKEGTVEVDPAKAGLSTKTIGAGKAVEVTPKRIGRAGKRGGLTRADALAKVIKIVARANTPCSITTPRTGAFGTKPAKGGWIVSVKVTGKSKGTAKWKAGKKTTPANKLAKKLAGGCR